jgi:hypothetical protein
MTPIEMHYSWLGFAYQVAVWFGNLFREKWFDVLLAAAGTRLGYWWAKKHLEHFVREFITEIVKKLDAKYLELNQKLAFQRAVTAMMPELPDFYLRPSNTLSPQVATAIGDFTHWSAAIDPAHTPEESMKLVGTQAYTEAAAMIEKDMGFKEPPSVPNYTWEIEIPLALGVTVDEKPDLTIFNWDTGVPAYRHARMEETKRTPTLVRYSWKWDTLKVDCGVYVGVVNFDLGGAVKIQETALCLDKRVRIFMTREKNHLVKSNESIPW